METGKPSASDWRMTQNPPHERERKRIYIAGPMQGIPGFNFSAFHGAAAFLRQQGWEVFSPAEHDEKQYGIGFAANNLAGDHTQVNGFDLRSALAADTQWISLHADAIYMLNGWEHSKGAQCEWALARALGLQIIYQAH